MGNKCVFGTGLPLPLKVSHPFHALPSQKTQLVTINNGLLNPARPVDRREVLALLDETCCAILPVFFV